MNTVRLRDFREAFAGRTPGPLDRYRYFSVLAPLVERDGVLHLLYQLRSENLRQQPGEVSFPGGKVEAGETPLACAVRETVEELGVPRESVEVVGALDYIHGYSDFTMYAFLGVIADTDFTRAFNRAEVQEVFLVPVSFFLENEPEIHCYEVAPRIDDNFPYDRILPEGGPGRRADDADILSGYVFSAHSEVGYKWRTGRVTVPIYHYEGRVIWGLTARITLNLIDILKQSMNDGAFPCL
jgi:8-oxo-dGTP pyrophosphatase MutT (NUDIX family)